MNFWSVLLLLIWVPCSLFTMLFLWSGFRETALSKQKVAKTHLERMIYFVISTAVFTAVCVIVGPMVTWRALTMPRPEE